MTEDKVIPLREYLSRIEAGPTEERMFLWNIIRHALELCQDFTIQ
jgi:hypothetical protein